MHMETNLSLFSSDADESALFRSSVALKRKTTENDDVVNSKQAKQKEKIKLNDEISGPEYYLSKNFCEKQNNSSSSTTDSDLFLNNLSSHYFKKKKNFNNQCFFCHKVLQSSTTYLSHIKKCKKRKNISSEQLLLVLKSEKNKIENHYMQSKELDSTLKNESFQKKSGIQNFESLNSSTSKFLEECIKNINIEANKKEKFLDQFFTINSNNIIGANIKKKRKKSIKSCLLLSITNDERQRIITEKAAVILLDENNDEKFHQHQNFKVKSSLLKKIFNETSYLWNLSENEKNFEWYVNQLKVYVTFEETLDKKNNHFISEKEEKNFSPKSHKFYIEKLKLNLPTSSKIDQNWREMINNQNLSDLTAKSKDGFIIYLHKLILNVRCPEVVNEDWKSVLEKFDFSTDFILLEYLYCGTLNSLQDAHFQNLIDLANLLSYEELINILNCLKKNLSLSLKEHLLPSMVTECDDFYKINNKKKFENMEERDLFEDNLVNFNQNTQKSFGELNVLNECNSSSKIAAEETLYDNFKVQLSLKKQNGINQNLLKENFETNHETSHNALDKVFTQLKLDLNADKDSQEIFSKKISNDCSIILSSDSDNEDLKSQKIIIKENIEDKILSHDSDCDIPYFDPYEDYNHLLHCNFSPIQLQNQSLTVKNISKCETMNYLSAEKKNKKVPKKSEISADASVQSIRINSWEKKSNKKTPKKKSDGIGSRILRKSLHLSLKSPKFHLENSKKKLSGKNCKRKKSENKNILNQLNNSLTHEFIDSPAFKSSTPTQFNTCKINKEFIEITPWSSRGFEIEESVTPYPNYSGMEEALLKHHLGKYGLKKNLGKKKAAKILKRIYEELHPYLNKETGKLVKRIVTETPKNHKKGKLNSTSNSRKKIIDILETNKKNSQINGTKKEKINIYKKNSNKTDDSKIINLEDISSDNPNNLSTKSHSPVSNSKDLSVAMIEFLKLNPDVHEKILLYEPIWVHDLQLKLKETFNKHYKINDLINYLDQKCITFRIQQKPISKSKNREKNFKDN